VTSHPGRLQAATASQITINTKTYFKDFISTGFQELVLNDI
jgi:hypothetical protein